MKHVLLIGNIDGNSVSFLKYASKFCKDQELKLHVLQIEPNNDPVFLSSPYYFNKAGFMVNSGSSKKKKELESFVLENTKDLIDSTWVSHELIRGTIEDSVGKFINDKKIDLVITRHRLFEKNDLATNETFRKIFLNVSDLPMLIIPDNQIYKSLQKIAHFTTFSEDDAEHIQWLIEHFKQPIIDLIHFSPTQDTLKELKWVNYLKSEIEDHSKVSYKHKDIKIENFINTEINTITPKYDCLVLTTHKRNFWEKILNPSTTINLIANLEVPALIFKYSTDQ